ncbi:hypothetical protein ACIRRA_03575 [Nocardia sp. NPDC101769]|uniref:hypothetical protein n=1 Tax=Nocardia sp. NPDC101769 TaxID=3364333 RepID=UPI00380D3E8A
MSQRNFPSADVDAAAHRTTERQRALFTLLGSDDRFRSAQQLHADLRTTGHHHNLLRRVCGRAEDFVLGELEHHTERIAHRHRYIDLEHHIDLYGTCPDCAAANPLADPERESDSTTSPGSEIR